MENTFATSRIDAQWNGQAIQVTARVIPRYFWSTVSINAYLDNKPIVKTGGQQKFTGLKRSEFEVSGVKHIAELSWTKPEIFKFYPYILSIDGDEVDKGQVYISNWYMCYAPVILLFALLVLGFYFLLT